MGDYMIEQSRKGENVHFIIVAILELCSGIKTFSALVKRDSHPWCAFDRQTVMAVSNQLNSGRLVVYHTVTILNIIQRPQARDPFPSQLRARYLR